VPVGLAPPALSTELGSPIQPCQTLLFRQFGESAWRKSAALGLRSIGGSTSRGKMCVDLASLQEVEAGFHFEARRLADVPSFRDKIPVQGLLLRAGVGINFSLAGEVFLRLSSFFPSLLG